MVQKVALVSGASSGIGESTARCLHEAGFIVYGAARSVDRMAALAAAGLQTVALDVTDESSTEKVVAEILAVHGRLDVLVNNAGYGSYGALEDVPMAEARSQIEVNLFGLAHLTRAVLPAMRARRSGTIVNISSMGGRLATPLGAWYHASKFAVEGLSDALRLELRRFGIDVVVIEPGLIRTEWGSKAARKLRATSSEGPYGDEAEAIAVSLENGARPDAPRTSSPDVVASAVARAATARRPRTRYTVGFGARPLLIVRSVLPDRAFDAFIRRISGLRA
ncbi:oxidoreductase [Pseudonocardia cypriaca]|uniref:Short-subunit dehydrogenase n=1 Tax=Pseudonocardia cypriaca TaxID=882449 RepID=A0A543G9C0_9PSEU|nr:oxidoreductase [Pseudonocardia cypriaca]TQM42687.1 short-subunit dehydrogenase [Pseudonocardia cypriaca]